MMNLFNGKDILAVLRLYLGRKHDRKLKAIVRSREDEVPLSVKLSDL